MSEISITVLYTFIHTAVFKKCVS